MGTGSVLAAAVSVRARMSGTSAVNNDDERWEAMATVKQERNGHSAINAEKLAEIDRGHFQDYEIKSVVEGEHSWSVSTTDSTGFGLGKEYGVEPQPGDRVRLFCHQLTMIHGIDLNGAEVFYKDKAQQDAERQAEIDKIKARKLEEAEAKADEWAASWASLPQPYQTRAAKFRRNNPDWWFEYQPYELFCCVEGHKIAGIVSQQIVTTGKPFPEIIDWIRALSWDEQTQLGISSDHSGNTMGFALRLAALEYTNPAVIPDEHGSMAPLVGCMDYGCHTEAEVTS